MTAATSPTTVAPERDIAMDMVKRGLPVAPVLIALGAAGWGVDGALSVAFAVGIVLVNFLLSAVALGWAARRSATVLMATALGGFAVRMVLVVVAVAAVKGQPWLETVPLGIAIVITHLGLLVWESRSVSASLAFPGLKPRTPRNP